MMLGCRSIIANRFLGLGYFSVFVKLVGKQLRYKRKPLIIACTIEVCPHIFQGACCLFLENVMTLRREGKASLLRL